jgi:GAF domain-containing protein
MPVFQHDPAVDDCAAILETNGLHALLAHLNQRTRHRYTGVYAFDPPVLRSLCLYDRENPGIVRGGDTPMSETYCSIVGMDSDAFATPDAGREPRLNSHPARTSVLAYCGVPLRNAAGECFGTLCHFDMRPRIVPTRELPILHAVAAMLPPFALAMFDGSLQP